MVTWTPPLQVQPDNLLVSSDGGRDNTAHSFTIRDTFVLSDRTVNAFRATFIYTDVHRAHEPLGANTEDRIRARDMRPQDWAFFAATAAALFTVTVMVRGGLVGTLAGIAMTAAAGWASHAL